MMIWTAAWANVLRGAPPATVPWKGAEIPFEQFLQNTATNALVVLRDAMMQGKFTDDRPPRALPRLVLDPRVDDLFAFGFDDVAIEGYDPHPAIRAPVAV